MADKEALAREKENERRRRLRELLELEARGEVERRVAPGKRELTSAASAINEGVRRGRAAAESLAAPGKRTMTMALSERLEAEAGRRDWDAVIAGAPLGPELVGQVRLSRGEERREDRERGQEGNGRREADGGEGQQEGQARGRERERTQARTRGRGRGKREEVEPDDALADQDAESDLASVEGLAERGRSTVQQGRQMARALDTMGGPMAGFGERLNALSGELDRRINTELSRFRSIPRTPEAAVRTAVNQNETASATVEQISGTARSARRRLEDDPIVSAAVDIANERQNVRDVVSREAQTAAADFSYQASRATQRMPDGVSDAAASGVDAVRDQLQAKVDPTREGAPKVDAQGNPIKDPNAKPEAPKPDATKQADAKPKKKDDKKDKKKDGKEDAKKKAKHDGDGDKKKKKKKKDDDKKHKHEHKKGQEKDLARGQMRNRGRRGRDRDDDGAGDERAEGHGGRRREHHGRGRRPDANVSTSGVLGTRQTANPNHQGIAPYTPTRDPGARATQMADELRAKAAQPTEITPSPVKPAPLTEEKLKGQQQPMRADQRSTKPLPGLNDTPAGQRASAEPAPPVTPEQLRNGGGPGSQYVPESARQQPQLNDPLSQAAAAVAAGGSLAAAAEGLGRDNQGAIEGNASQAAHQAAQNVGGVFTPSGAAAAAGHGRMAAANAAAAHAAGPAPSIPGAEPANVPAAPAFAGTGGGGGGGGGAAPAVNTAIRGPAVNAPAGPSMPAAGGGGGGSAMTPTDIGSMPEVQDPGVPSSDSDIPDASAYVPPPPNTGGNQSAATASMDAEVQTKSRMGPDAQSNISSQVSPTQGEMSSRVTAESGPPRQAAMSSHNSEATSAANEGRTAMTGEASTARSTQASNASAASAHRAQAAAIPQPGMIGATAGLAFGAGAQATMAAASRPTSQPFTQPAGAEAMAASGDGMTGDVAGRQPDLSRTGEVDQPWTFPALETAPMDTARGSVNTTMTAGAASMNDLPMPNVKMGGPAAVSSSSVAPMTLPAPKGAGTSGGGAAGGGAAAAAGAAGAMPDIGASKGAPDTGGAAGGGQLGTRLAAAEAERAATIRNVEQQVAAQVATDSNRVMGDAARPAAQEVGAGLTNRGQQMDQRLVDSQGRAQSHHDTQASTPPPVTSASAATAGQQAFAPHQARAAQAVDRMNSDIDNHETQAHGRHQAAIGTRNAQAAQATAGMAAGIEGANSGYQGAHAGAVATYDGQRSAAQSTLQSTEQAAEQRATQATTQAQTEGQQQQQQAQQRMTADSQAAEQNATAEQDRARQEADTERQARETEMDSEIEAAHAQGESDIETERARGDADVQAAFDEGDQRIQNDINTKRSEAEAEENRARQEKAAKEAELERKRREEQEERDNRSGIGVVTGWLGDRVSDAVSAIRDAINSLIDAIKSIVSAVCDFIADCLSALKDMILSALEWLKDRVLDVLEAVKNAIQAVISAVMDAVRAFISLVADAIRALIEIVATVLNAIIEVLETVLNTIIEAAQWAFNAALDTFIAAVSLVNEDWGNAVQNATQGFRDTVNNAADSAQQNISAAADAAQNTVTQTAERASAVVTAAEQQAIETVNRVEEDLHQAVEVAYEVGVATVEAAFEVAEFVVEATTDIAIAGVNLAGQTINTALQLGQAAMYGDMDMAMDALGDWADAASEVGAAIVEHIPGPLKEAFIDFWNSQWRDIILGGLIAIGAGLLIATGVGAIVVIAIGVGVGAATYGGGELLAQEAAQDLHEETGNIYVPGQGYISTQVGPNGELLIKGPDGKVVGGYVNAQGQPVPPGTPGAQLVVPEGQDPSQYEWALRNFNITADGVTDKSGRDMAQYVGYEALEGAFQGGMAAASAVGGSALGGFAAKRLLGQGVVQAGERMVAQRMIGAAGEGVVDWATSGVTSGSQVAIEGLEHGQSFSQAASGGWNAASQTYTDPTNIGASLAMVGGSGFQARFLDGLGVMARPGARQFIDAGLETTYETAGTYAGGYFTEQGPSLDWKQVAFSGLMNIGGSYSERLVTPHGSTGPGGGNHFPPGGFPDSNGPPPPGTPPPPSSTTRQGDGGTVTTINNTGPTNTTPSNSTTRQGTGGTVTTVNAPGGSQTVPGGTQTTQSGGSQTVPGGTQTTQSGGTQTQPGGTQTQPGGTQTRPVADATQPQTQSGNNRPPPPTDGPPRTTAGSPEPDGPNNRPGDPANQTTSNSTTPDRTVTPRQGVDAAPGTTRRDGTPTPDMSAVPRRLDASSATAAGDAMRPHLTPDSDVDAFNKKVAEAEAGDLGALGELEAIRRWLGEGRTVRVRPEVQNQTLPDGTTQTNPDYEVDGQIVEVKSRDEGFNGNWLANRVNAANKQVRNSSPDGAAGSVDIQFRGDQQLPDIDTIDREVRRNFNPDRGSSLDNVRIVQDGQVVGEWSRTRGEGGQPDTITRTFPVPDATQTGDRPPTGGPPPPDVGGTPARRPTQPTQPTGGGAAARRPQQGGPQQGGPQQSGTTRRPDGTVSDPSLAGDTGFNDPKAQRTHAGDAQAVPQVSPETTPNLANQPRTTSEIPELAVPPPPLSVIAPGQQVRVMRSDGTLDPGWTVMGTAPDGRVVVGRDGMQKVISPGELLSVNALQPGAPVVVPRSSGELQPGWRVVGDAGNGNVTVSDGTHVKQVPADVLLVVNRVEPGVPIRVRRSDGTINDGWTVIAVDPSNGNVTAMGPDGAIKRVPMQDTIALNRDSLLRNERPARPPGQQQQQGQQQRPDQQQQRPDQQQQGPARRRQVDMPAPLPNGEARGTRQMDGPLYRTDQNGMPILDWTDIRQGGLGDCYFVSNLIGMAHTRPDLVRQMIHDNGDGTFDVTFHTHQGPQTVTVDNRFYVDAQGNPVYSNPGLADPPAGSGRNQPEPVMWGLVMEKAWARLNGGYPNIEGNNGPLTAEFALTGQERTRVNTDGRPPADIGRMIDDAGRRGQPVTLTSRKDAASQPMLAEAGLVGAHRYTVFSNGDGTFNIFNPWGHSHALGVDADFIARNFGQVNFVNTSYARPFEGSHSPYNDGSRSTPPSSADTPWTGVPLDTTPATRPVTTTSTTPDGTRPVTTTSTTPDGTRPITTTSTTPDGTRPLSTRTTPDGTRTTPDGTRTTPDGTRTTTSPDGTRTTTPDGTTTNTTPDGTRTTPDGTRTTSDGDTTQHLDTYDDAGYPRTTETGTTPMDADGPVPRDRTTQTGDTSPTRRTTGDDTTTQPSRADTPHMDGDTLASQTSVAVGHRVRTEGEAQDIIRALADGDASVLQRLGIDVPPDFDSMLVEWGIGYDPVADNYVIIRGTGMYVDWGPFPGLIAIAHSHPIHSGLPLLGGPNGDGRVTYDWLTNPDANRDAVRFFPSGADFVFVMRGGIMSHEVHTPFRHLGTVDGQHRIGNPSPDNTGAAGITIEIRDPRFAGDFMGNPNLPMVSAEIVVRAGDTVIDGPRVMYAADHPMIGSMISFDPFPVPGFIPRDAGPGARRPRTQQPPGQARQRPGDPRTRAGDQRTAAGTVGPRDRGPDLPDPSGRQTQSVAGDGLPALNQGQPGPVRPGDTAGVVPTAATPTRRRTDTADTSPRNEARETFEQFNRPQDVEEVHAAVPRADAVVQALAQGGSAEVPTGHAITDDSFYFITSPATQGAIPINVRVDDARPAGVDLDTPDSSVRVATYRMVAGDAVLAGPYTVYVTTDGQGNSTASSSRPERFRPTDPGLIRDGSGVAVDGPMTRDQASQTVRALASNDSSVLPIDVRTAMGDKATNSIEWSVARIGDEYFVVKGHETGANMTGATIPEHSHPLPGRELGEPRSLSALLASGDGTYMIPSVGDRKYTASRDLGGDADVLHLPYVLMPDGRVGNPADVPAGVDAPAVSVITHGQPTRTELGNGNVSDTFTVEYVTSDGRSLGTYQMVAGFDYSTFTPMIGSVTQVSAGDIGSTTVRPEPRVVDLPPATPEQAAALRTPQPAPDASQPHIASAPVDRATASALVRRLADGDTSALQDPAMIHMANTPDFDTRLVEWAVARPLQSQGAEGYVVVMGDPDRVAYSDIGVVGHEHSHPLEPGRYIDRPATIDDLLGGDQWFLMAPSSADLMNSYRFGQTDHVIHLPYTVLDGQGRIGNPYDPTSPDMLAAGQQEGLRLHIEQQADPGQFWMGPGTMGYIHEVRVRYESGGYSESRDYYIIQHPDGHHEISFDAAHVADVRAQFIQQSARAQLDRPGTLGQPRSREVAQAAFDRILMGGDSAVHGLESIGLPVGSGTTVPDVTFALGRRTSETGDDAYVILRGTPDGVRPPPGVEIVQESRGYFGSRSDGTQQDSARNTQEAGAEPQRQRPDQPPPQQQTGDAQAPRVHDNPRAYFPLVGADDTGRMRFADAMDSDHNRALIMPPPQLVHAMATHNMPEYTVRARYDVDQNGMIGPVVPGADGNPILFRISDTEVVGGMFGNAEIPVTRARIEMTVGEGDTAFRHASEMYFVRHPSLGDMVLFQSPDLGVDPATGVPAQTPPPARSENGADLATRQNTFFGPALPTVDDARTILRRLADGDRTQLAELGFTDVPDTFHTNSVEWGIARVRNADGTEGFMLIRGEPDAVGWPENYSSVSMETIVGHVHPHSDDRMFPVGDDAITVQQAMENGTSAQRTWLSPSGADLRLIGGSGQDLHVIHLPFVHLGDGRIGNSALSTPSGNSIDVHVHGPETVGNYPSGEPVNRVRLDYYDGDQLLWSGDMYHAYVDGSGDHLWTEMPPFLQVQQPDAATQPQEASTQPDQGNLQQYGVSPRPEVGVTDPTVIQTTPHIQIGDPRSLETHLDALDRIAAGYPRAIEWVGAQAPDWFGLPDARFAVLRRPDGEHILVRGDQAGIDMARFPGHTLVAEAAPFRSAQPLPGLGRGDTTDLRNLIDSETAPDRVLPSRERIERMFAQGQQSLIIQSSLQHRGDGQVAQTQPRGGRLDHTVRYQVMDVRQIGTIGGNPDVPVLQAHVYALTFDGQMLWHGDVYTGLNSTVSLDPPLSLLPWAHDRSGAQVDPVRGAREDGSVDMASMLDGPDLHVSRRDLLPSSQMIEQVVNNRFSTQQLITPFEITPDGGIRPAQQGSGNPPLRVEIADARMLGYRGDSDTPVYEARLTFFGSDTVPVRSATVRFSGDEVLVGADGMEIRVDRQAPRGLEFPAGDRSLGSDGTIDQILAGPDAHLIAPTGANGQLEHMINNGLQHARIPMSYVHLGDGRIGNRADGPNSRGAQVDLVITQPPRVIDRYQTPGREPFAIYQVTAEYMSGRTRVDGETHTYYVFSNPLLGTMVSTDPASIDAWHQMIETGAALDRNAFTIGRGMRSGGAGDNNTYAGNLGPHFESDVGRWDGSMRVLDAGAGEANFLREIVTQNRQAGTQPPQMVAIGVRRPNLDDGALDGIDYREGYLGTDQRRLENDLGLGSFDRIVDSYGASHYARDLDTVLESYGLLLREGGQAHLHFDLDHTSLVDAAGNPQSVESYLRSIEGVRIANIEMDTDRNMLRVSLERTGGDLTVPPLQLVQYTDGRPPVRVYRTNPTGSDTSLPPPKVDPDRGSSGDDRQQASPTPEVPPPGERAGFFQRWRDSRRGLGDPVGPTDFDAVATNVNMPVGHAIRDRATALDIFHTLNDVTRTNTGLNRLGVRNTPTSSSIAPTWGLAQLPDGTFVILRAQHGKPVDFSGLEGATPLAVSRNDNSIGDRFDSLEPGAVDDLLRHPTQGATVRDRLLPSAADIRHIIDQDMGSLTYITRLSSDGRTVGNSQAGVPGVSTTVSGVRMVGEWGGNPVYSADVVIHSPDGIELWRGTTYATQMPYRSTISLDVPAGLTPLQRVRHDGNTAARSSQGAARRSEGAAHDAAASDMVARDSEQVRADVEPSTVDPGLITPGGDATASARGRDGTTSAPDRSRMLSDDELVALHPKTEDIVYHDIEHTRIVSDMTYQSAIARGLTPDQAQFLAQVGQLHDIDPDRTPGSPARVPATVQALMDDFAGRRPLIDGYDGSVLRDRFGWGYGELVMGMGIIRRTEFPFADPHRNPVYAKTVEFRGESLTLDQVTRYQILLDQVGRLRPDAVQFVSDPVGFVMREAALMSEYADKGNYAGRDFESAANAVIGLSHEIGIPVTALDTVSFLDDVGAAGVFDVDAQVAARLGRQAPDLPGRDAFYSQMPDEYGQRYRAQVDGFRAFDAHLKDALNRAAADKGGPLDANESAHVIDAALPDAMAAGRNAATASLGRDRSSLDAGIDDAIQARQFDELSSAKQKLNLRQIDVALEILQGQLGGAKGKADSFNITPDQVQAFARVLGGEFHGQWAADYKAQNGEGAQRWKAAKDDDFSEAARLLLERDGADAHPNLRIAEDGTVEIDIANSTFDQLSPAWQKENFEAAIVIGNILVDANVQSISVSGLRRAVNEAITMNDAGVRLQDGFADAGAEQRFVLFAGNTIHDSWLDRNGAWAEATQKVPFVELTPDQQKLDLRQLDQGIDVEQQQRGATTEPIFNPRARRNAEMQIPASRRDAHWTDAPDPRIARQLEDIQHILIDVQYDRGGQGDVAAGYLTAFDLAQRYQYRGTTTLLVSEQGMRIVSRMTGRKLADGEVITTPAGGQVRFVTADNYPADAVPADLVMGLATSSPTIHENPLNARKWGEDDGNPLPVSPDAVIGAQQVFGNTEGRHGNEPNARMRSQGQDFEYRTPGLNPTEGGVYTDPVAYRLRGLSPDDTRAELLASIDRMSGETYDRNGTPYRSSRDALAGVLTGDLLEGTQPGLAYGLSVVPDQVDAYINGLTQRANASDGGITVITPSRFPDHLKGRDDVVYFRAQDVDQIPAKGEKGKIYVIETESMPHEVFVGLMADSRITPIVSGDGALAAAVTLGKPFAMTVLPHNAEIIKDIRNRLDNLAEPEMRPLIDVLFSERPDLQFAHLMQLTDYRHLFEVMSSDVPSATDRLVDAALRVREYTSSQIEGDALLEAAHTADPALRVSRLMQRAGEGDVQAARMVAAVMRANPGRWADLVSQGRLPASAFQHESVRHVVMDSWLRSGDAVAARGAGAMIVRAHLDGVPGATDALVHVIERSPLALAGVDRIAPDGITSDPRVANALAANTDSTTARRLLMDGVRRGDQPAIDALLHQLEGSPRSALQTLDASDLEIPAVQQFVQDQLRSADEVNQVLAAQLYSVDEAHALYALSNLPSPEMRMTILLGLADRGSPGAGTILGRIMFMKPDALTSAIAAGDGQHVVEITPDQVFEATGGRQDHLGDHVSFGNSMQLVLSGPGRVDRYDIGGKDLAIHEFDARFVISGQATWTGKYTYQSGDGGGEGFSYDSRAAQSWRDHAARSELSSITNNPHRPLGGPMDFMQAGEVLKHLQRGDVEQAMRLVGIDSGWTRADVDVVWGIGQAADGSYRVVIGNRHEVRFGDLRPVAQTAFGDQRYMLKPMNESGLDGMLGAPGSMDNWHLQSMLPTGGTFRRLLAGDATSFLIASPFSQRDGRNMVDLQVTKVELAGYVDGSPDRPVYKFELSDTPGEPGRTAWASLHGDRVTDVMAVPPQDLQGPKGKGRFLVEEMQEGFRDFRQSKSGKFLLIGTGVMVGLTGLAGVATALARLLLEEKEEDDGTGKLGPGDSSPYSSTDVNQGSLGDCYLLASIAAIAHRNPDLMDAMIVHNENGSYTVTFYSEDGKSVLTITLNGAFPTDKEGNDLYAQHGDDDEIWVQLLEKAYAQMKGSYEEIGEGGWMSGPMTQITGNPAQNNYNPKYYEGGHFGFDNTAARWKAGQAITLGSLSDEEAKNNKLYQGDDPVLHSGHAYFVTAVDPKARTVTVHNPWGWAYGDIVLTEKEFNDAFYGSVAVDPIQHEEEEQEGN